MASTIQTDLLREYQEINPEFHETVHGPPTALQFMRMVHISRPVLFENCPLPTRAEWTNEYLSANVGEVRVAVTPDGRADALVDDENGQTYFVEPLEEKMPMRDLLNRLHKSVEDQGLKEETVYLQSQNDNLDLVAQGEDGEFQGIRGDVPSDISWATEALGTARSLNERETYSWGGHNPDAVNIWIGNHLSATSVHCDPYENIYAVLRGTKVFTLFPPTEGWCLKEQEYPHARWGRGGDGRLVLVPTSQGPVRWSSVRDPTVDLPPARPVKVVVREGQMLYLPVGWWHYVQQLPDKTGVAVAVNYWYDQEMGGHSWVFLNFLRSLRAQNTCIRDI